MPRIWADKVAETSTTTGTGAFTLAGALTGYRTFGSVMTAPSDTCGYMITAVDSDGVPTGDWETGVGTYSGSNTLTRSIVQASSNAGSAVNFAAGTKRVTLTQNAAATRFRGAMATLASDAVNVDYTTATVIPWTSEEYDTDSIHDNSVNNSRLTVPAGVSRVRLFATVSITAGTALDWISFRFNKNGSPAVGLPFTRVEQGSTAQGVDLASAVVNVVQGDYFEVQMQIESDTTVTIASNRSCFAMEVVE